MEGCQSLRFFFDSLSRRGLTSTTFLCPPLSGRFRFPNIACGSVPSNCRLLAVIGFRAGTDETLHITLALCHLLGVESYINLSIVSRALTTSLRFDHLIEYTSIMVKRLDN